MFVIPMAGLSSRFFKAGYTQPKYQLSLDGKSVFERALSSFSAYFASDLFVIILRDVYDTQAFVEAQLQHMGIRHYHISVLTAETAGQAETVYLGLQALALAHDEPLYIFNIDTFRYGFQKPTIAEHCDGYLEVFRGEGEHWSFIEVDADGQVTRTTEKERISDLCSDGLYFFRSYRGFMQLFETTKAQGLYTKGELYIAPMYNQMIASGQPIGYVLIDDSEIDFCGTPDEYVYLQQHGLKAD